MAVLTAPDRTAGATAATTARFAGPGADELEITPFERLSVKIRSEDTQGRCAVMEFETLPGAGVPPHIHYREDEMFHVLAGSYAITVGDRTRVVRAGDYAFLPRGIVHGWQHVSEMPGCLIVTVTPGGMERMFEEMNACVAALGGVAATANGEVRARILSIADDYDIVFPEQSGSR